MTAEVYSIERVIFLKARLIVCRFSYKKIAPFNSLLFPLFFACRAVKEVVDVCMQAKNTALGTINSEMQSVILTRMSGETKSQRIIDREMTRGFLIQLVFCKNKKLCGLLVLK